MALARSVGAVRRGRKSDESASVFRALADDWKGDDGDQTWESIEHDLTIKAKRTLGHVVLTFTLRENYQPNVGRRLRWSRSKRARKCPDLQARWTTYSEAHNCRSRACRRRRCSRPRVSERAARRVPREYGISSVSTEFVIGSLLWIATLHVQSKQYDDRRMRRACSRHHSVVEWRSRRQCVRSRGAILVPTR